MTNFDEIKLLPATFDDMRLLYEITQESMSHLNSNQKEIEYSEEQRKNHYEKYVKEFTAEIPNTFIVYFEDKIIGRLRIVRNKINIHLGGIQLLPEFTGQGIGGEIVDQIINEAISKNQNITLLVHKTNPRAIKFYQNKNFKISEETEKQFKMIFQT